MNHSQVIIDSASLSPLAEELAQIGQSLVKLGRKFQQLTTRQTIPLAKVSPKTDPEMFTKDFIRTVRQSRQEFKKGQYTDYLEFRKSLDLK